MGLGLLLLIALAAVFFVLFVKRNRQSRLKLQEPNYAVIAFKTANVFNYKIEKSYLEGYAELEAVRTSLAHYILKFISYYFAVMD